MANQNLPDEFLRRLESIQGKRSKVVVNHILNHGFVTSEDLKNIYGYVHPPRAVRDVREQGIPIERFNTEDADGKRIAAYRFGNPSEVRPLQSTGRTALSAQIKSQLIAAHGARCNIYMEPFPERELQVDHRIPFEIAGDPSSGDIAQYMLLCPSANRAKSWSCENCGNWQVKDLNVCRTCYWAYPEGYTHVAMRDIRRLDLVWVGEESSEYDALSTKASDAHQDMPEHVKGILRRHLGLTE